MDARQLIIVNPYDTITEEYEKRNAWGLACSIDVKNADANLIRCKDSIIEFTHMLCDLIDMKRYGDTTVVHFGENEKVAGYSMVQLIETSCISAHFRNEDNSVYLDIFSCKLYNPYEAKEFTQRYFQGSHGFLTINYRV